MAAGEIVTVVVGGQSYTAFETIKVRAGVKKAARSFALKIAAEAGPDATASIFQPYVPVQIFAMVDDGSAGGQGGQGGGDLIFTGYVDKYKAKLSKHEAYIEIEGRSKGQDIVDSSADHQKSDYVQKTPLDIAQDQDVYGVGFSAGPGLNLTPVDQWRPNPGQPLFHALDQLCHDAECTMAGQPDGSIQMTQAGAAPPRQPTPLIEGVNILIIEGDLDVSDIHSDVTAHGQAAYGTGAQNTQISATASNSTVKRKRKLHIHHHHHTDQNRISLKAKNHRDKEAGNGIKASVTVQGWHDDSGMLWTPGNVVWLQSPFAAIVQDMLIESVDYTQDSKEPGSLCKMELVDPRAHGGQGGGVNKSGPSWQMDSSDAQPASPSSTADTSAPGAPGLY